MPSTRHRSIALLRGINVGGHAVIKMAELKELFESLGLKDVGTHIQSGNVLFTADETDRERLASRLEREIERSLGHAVTVFVLSPKQLRDAAAHNPFDPERLDEKQRCHLMFLSREPDAAQRKALTALQGDDYRLHVRGRVLYYAYPRDLEGRRRTINFEKVLGTAGTARSWKVIDELIRLSS
jgi:uncharacterized protein (DUF1697 family)